jgi:lipopolysaccharide/colanic/teichoic acid biosynthesis glycosyltransferase
VKPLFGSNYVSASGDSGAVTGTRERMVSLLGIAAPVSRRRFDGACKRLLDVAVAAFVLVLFLPVLAIVAAAIKLDSRGPVFFRCRRVGFRGSQLAMLKFRKMHDSASGVALTLADDARFTRIGRSLAKTKLDELPQLWNVLKGEMTLVGTRPEDPGFVELRREDYEVILSVKPGVTGLCQLAFAKESEILDARDRVGKYVTQLLPQKAALDRLYVERRSFLMDLKILVWTAVAVLVRRDVAVHRSTAGLTLRQPRTAPALATATAEGQA